MKNLFLLFSLNFVFLSPFFNFNAHAQWKKLDAKTDASFRSIHTVNEKIVWAGGTKGTVLKSVNGGKTWQILKVKDAENLDFRDIYAVNDKIAYLMSAGEAEKSAAKILKTINGGQNWEVVFQTTEKGVFFDSMDFFNQNEGIVLSDPIDDKPFIIKTLDGGKSWNRISKDKLPNINKGEASFAASGTCVFVKGSKVWLNTQSRIFYSADKGETWQVAETPFKIGETSGIFGLHFWDDNNGVAVGGDYKNDKKITENIALTTDGGKSWGLLSLAIPDGLKESAFLINNQQLVLVGTSGTSLSKDLGKTWQSIDNESFHAISCHKKTCFAIGGKGNLGKWEF